MTVTDTSVAIESMTRQDWDAVRAIYREGLATGLAAFMADPPSWRAWDAKQIAGLRFVARRVTGSGGGGVAGWAALGAVPDT